MAKANETIEELMKNKFIFFLLVGSLGFGGSTIKELTIEKSDPQKIDTLSKELAEFKINIVEDVSDVKGDVKVLKEILVRVEDESKSTKQELKEIKTLLLNMRRK